MYLERTTALRNSSPQLFLSCIHPVVKRLCCSLVENPAGVTGGYTVHSVRGAATSAAFLKGMLVLDIIKVADWSSDNTFKAFYYKPISEQKCLLPLLVQQ